MTHFYDATFDTERESGQSSKDKFRSEFRRDFARLVHSPAFRRLQDKTQLIPGVQSDFYRNRLTHSMEVAQVAKSIAQKLNSDLEKNNRPKIDLDLVEFAGLAHDLGHPPFGHTGEAVLNEKKCQCMADLRVMRKLCVFWRGLKKKKTTTLGGRITYKEYEDGRDLRLGLDLTFRSLASIIKYDEKIGESEKRKNVFQKGYYKSEAALVERIRKAIYRGANTGPLKTVEMQIMDIADDIAYSTYDLEDAFKSGLTSPMEILHRIDTDPYLLDRLATQIFKSQNSKIYLGKKTPEKKDGKKYQKIRNEIKSSVRRLFLPLISNPHRSFARLSDILISKAFDAGKNGDALEDHIEFFSRLKADLSVLGALGLAEQSDLITQNGYHRTAFSSGIISKRITKIDIVFNKQLPAMSKIRIDRRTAFDIEVMKRLNFELNIKSPQLRLIESRGTENCLRTV